KDQKEDLGQEVSKKRPREAANYFVAIPVKNDQILDRIEDVQELIFTKEPLLLKTFLPVQTMHITLIVAHLGTEDDIKKAVLALKQSKIKVEALLQGKDFHMRFHGIGQFNDQVLYVNMLEEDKKMLIKITEAVEECFIEMNLDISGSKDFIPHLTFLKFSKAPSLKRRGFRKICSDLYKEFEDSYFGTEVFSQIDLCAMKKKKQESGYYYCECSIHVSSTGMEKNEEQ
ncbi:AKA7G protein, partial [Indicator maculatus]|nr:AKA7G protein [Indicator maculatus]